MPRRTDACLVLLVLLALLLLCCLPAPTLALYKQWIPDTNYENRSNWDTGAVPCGGDRAVFPGQGSVYVETAHSVQEMTLPLHGELILASGAGFYPGGAEEPGCGGGGGGREARFRDSDPLRWFDPALWRAALTPEDLEDGRHLFSVHEESVPCRHDDVVFRAASSFRVDTTSSSSSSSVTVRSVSVLGQTFSRQADLARYLGSASGRWQFHGGAALALDAAGCADPAGCVCDNSANRDRICEGVACSAAAAAACRTPLRPAGHCCAVCGALVWVRFSPGFSLLSYRRRVQQLFLGRPAYSGVRLGMSRVPGAPSRAAADRVQVVVLDGGPGLVAEALARDLLADARAHGADLGISGADLEASSGDGPTPGPRGGLAGALVGAFFGVLLLVVVGAGVVVALRRRGWTPPRIAMPTMPAVPWPRRGGGGGDEALGGPLDAGFENPMFDKPGLLPAIPGIYGAEMSPISMTTSGVHFVNPAYDDHETDVTV